MRRLFTRNKKKLKLEFCTNNLDRFYNDDDLDELEDLIEEKDVNLREMDCLSYCDECECSPYVLINNQFAQESSPSGIITLLKEKIEEKN